MNKLLTKAAKILLGLSLAAGVGVAVGNNKTASQALADSTSFVAGTDTGSGSVTKNHITVATSTMNRTDNYRMNSGASLVVSGDDTISSITEIVLTHTTSSGNYSPDKITTANVGSISKSGNKTTWSGSATSITFSNSAQVRLTQIDVTYSVSSGTTHNLTYSAGSHGTYDGSTTSVFALLETTGTQTVKNPSDVGITADSGYNFTGWNTASNGSGQDYAVGSTFTMGNSDTTLYAQWEAEVLNNEIVFDVAENDSSQESNGDAIKDFIVSGKGYVSSISDQSKIYKATHGLKMGTGSAVGTFTINFDTTKNSSLNGLALYAEILKYGSDSGSFIFTSSQLTGSPVSISKPASLTKTLIGTFSAAPVSLTIATSTTRGYLQSLSFETPSGYTVSFDPGAGDGTMASVPYVSGSYTLPSCTFTAPSGYEFAGWKANNSGDDIAAGGSYTVSADVTFYAQWSEIAVAQTYARITDISKAAQVVITTTKGGDNYYLPAATTSSAPTALTCTITNNELTDVDASNLFTVSITSGRYVFQNSNSKYLYTTNNNNGIRIGDTSDSWTLTEVSSGLYKMQSHSNSLWCGVYNTQDWRSYGTSDHANYGGSAETIAFYGIEKAASPLDSIELRDYPTTTLDIGDTANLSYYGLDGNGDEWAGNVVYTSSDTSVATVDENGLLTAVGAGSTNITVYANAGVNDAKVESDPVIVSVSSSYAKGTAQNPYTVSEARTAIDNGSGLTNVHTSGIISQVDSFNSTYGSITYWISADGLTSSAQLKIYGGLNLSSAQFTSGDDLQVGDEVTVCGTLKLYQSTYEYDLNNYLTSFNRPEVSLVSISSISGTLEANSGDLSWVLSGLTVNGVLSSGLDVVDVTRFVNLTTEDVPGTVSETTVRNVSVTATGKDDSSITLTQNVQGTINVASGLVNAGQYRIKATRDGTTYYLKENGSSSAPSAVTDFWEATIFTFTLIGDNIYNISCGENYLYATNTNNGVRFGVPQDASNKNWTIETGESTLDGAYNFIGVGGTRFLTLYNSSDWRTYTSATAGNREENTDLQEFNASQFATEFLGTYTAGCNAEGGYTAADMKWDTASTQYSFLSSADQNSFKNAEYTKSGSGSNTVITPASGVAQNVAEVVARYDYIVGRYGTDTFGDFMDRSPAYFGGAKVLFASVIGDNTNTVAIIVIISLVSVTAIGGYFFLKKRREQN